MVIREWSRGHYCHLLFGFTGIQPGFLNSGHLASSSFSIIGTNLVGALGHEFEGWTKSGDLLFRMHNLLRRRICRPTTSTLSRKQEGTREMLFDITPFICSPCCAHPFHGHYLRFTTPAQS